MTWYDSDSELSVPSDRQRCDCEKPAHSPQPRLGWVTLRHLLWCLRSHHRLRQSSQGHASSHTPQINFINTIKWLLNRVLSYLCEFAEKTLPLKSWKLNLQRVLISDWIGRTVLFVSSVLYFIKLNLTCIKALCSTMGGAKRECMPQRSNMGLNSFDPLRCGVLTPRFTPAPGKRAACVREAETAQSSPTFTKRRWDRTARRHRIMYKLNMYTFLFLHCFHCVHIIHHYSCN